MKLPMTLLTAFSLFSCAHIRRPNAELCVVNAPAAHLKCYNVAEDYNEGGYLKPRATAKFFRAENVHDLNKGVWMSNADWAKIKVWISDLRRAYEESRK